MAPATRRSALKQRDINAQDEFQPLKSPVRRFYADRALLRTPIKSMPAFPGSPTSPHSLSAQSPVIKGEDSVHVLRSQLNVERLQDILSEFKVRYASHPDTQLTALLENTEFYLSNSHIKMLPFGSKRFALTDIWIDGCYPHVPEVFRAWLIETLDQYPENTVQIFFGNVVFGLLDLQKEVSCTTTVHVSLGHQIFLQIMMRHFRRRLRLLDTISRIVTLYPNYLSSTSIAHTLLWILVQNVQSSDIVIWFEYLLTAYTESATSSVTTVKRLAVEHIRLVMQSFPEEVSKRPVYLAANRIESLMLLVCSKNNLLTGHPNGENCLKNLAQVYYQVKGLILQHESGLTSSLPKLFYAFLSHTSSKDPGIRDESLMYASKLLTFDPTCLSQWKSLYEEKLAESAVLLSYLEANWEKQNMHKSNSRDFEKFLVTMNDYSDSLSRKRGRRSSFGSQRFHLNECSKTIDALMKKSKPLKKWNVFLLSFLAIAVIMLVSISIIFLDEKQSSYLKSLQHRFVENSTNLTSDALHKFELLTRPIRVKASFLFDICRTWLYETTWVEDLYFLIQEWILFTVLFIRHYVELVYQKYKEVEPILIESSSVFMDKLYIYAKALGAKAIAQIITARNDLYIFIENSMPN